MEEMEQEKQHNLKPAVLKKMASRDSGFSRITDICLMKKLEEHFQFLTDAKFPCLNNFTLILLLPVEPRPRLPDDIGISLKRF